MKKLLFTALLIITSVCVAFGQVDSKNLLIGTNSFITEESADWKIYDGAFTSVDPMSEEYTFVGGFVIKGLVGLSRYDFICTVKNEGNDFSVSISDLESYACDKNGKIIKSGTVRKSSANVASQYAAQMKTEIQNRMNSISDTETMYTKIVTSPNVLNTISNTMTELAFKKFVEANVNGKPVDLTVKLRSIDENRNPITNELYPLNYKANGSVQVYAGSWGRLSVTESFSVSVYSNNDKLLSAKTGSEYAAKGTLSYRQIGSGSTKFWIYEINEE
jgi:hypothetical protein